jgi:phosphoenolpyruvate synthase/pyruvate phosphate dikinase
VTRPAVEVSDPVAHAAQAGGVITVADDTIRVVAVYGVFVDESVGTDTYLLDAPTLDVIRREIGRKTRAYRWSEADGGLVLKDVPPVEHDRSVLGIGQLQRLGELALGARPGRGEPLRWAITGERVSLLRATPRSA